MREIGLAIQCKGEVFILGRMGESTKVSIIKIKNMAMEYINGLMEEVTF